MIDTAPLIGITSQAACLNIAADYTDRADEERIYIKDLSRTVREIANTAILGLSCILTVAILGSLSLAYFSGVSVSIVMDATMFKTFQGTSLILGLAVSLAVHNLYQISKHLDLARTFEHYALSANAKAAEMPAWQDRGLIAKLWGRLFTVGNSVTRFGKNNIGGRRYSH